MENYKTIGRVLKKKFDADFDFYYEKYSGIARRNNSELKMKKENKYIIFYHLIILPTLDFE